MTNDTLARLQQMSRDQQETRFQELLQRHNIAPVPAMIPDGCEPIEIPLEEMEEREWLKNYLGYK
jgi:hypothetical protein